MSSFKEHRYLNMPNWLLFVDGTISIISSFFGWMCDSSRWILFLLFWEKESCESTYSIGREVCQSMKIERVSSVQQERYDLRCAATVFYCTVCKWCVLVWMSEKDLSAQFKWFHCIVESLHNLSLQSEGFIPIVFRCFFLSFFSHFYSFIHIFIAMDYVSSHSIILLCIKFK